MGFAPTRNILKIWLKVYGRSDLDFLVIQQRSPILKVGQTFHELELVDNSSDSSLLH